MCSWDCCERSKADYCCGQMSRDYRRTGERANAKSSASLEWHTINIIWHDSHHSHRHVLSSIYFFPPFSAPIFCAVAPNFGHTMKRMLIAIGGPMSNDNHPENGKESNISFDFDRRSIHISALASLHLLCHSCVRRFCYLYFLFRSSVNAVCA